ncbi:PWWP domain-containing DNA repair factor 3B isoform X2 [Conger conger]|uniref:PWWP domain-containing DNA repair factor 3B isoform X2 n=1 Tax=Conger conger TaxID=82655 RepID=UPI002A599A26|nr:PWWP domain-containing DNA repair factor 3B isoform X2 [Conger conger]
MEECTHVLLPWKGRSWPAKVLPKPNFRRRKEMEVEILGEEERVRIAEKETLPMTLDRVKSLCPQPSQTVAQPVEELRYRKALRLALNVFSADGPRSSPPGGSPRRSCRRSPASVPTPPPVLRPRSPKVAAQTVLQARSTPGGQQGAAVSGSSGEPETGRSRARDQEGHAPPNPTLVKRGQGSHGARKQRKRREGKSERVGERRSERGGRGTAAATPTYAATPKLRRTNPIRGRRSQETSPPDPPYRLPCLPSPTPCGPDQGSGPTPPPRKRLLSSLLSSTPDPAHASESPEEAELVTKRRLRQRRNQSGGGVVTRGCGQPAARRNGGFSDTPPAAKRWKGVCEEAEHIADCFAQSNGSLSRPSARHRARFQPAEEPEGPGDTSLSSDLSIELSVLEDSALFDSSLLEEDEGEEEQLPSFLLQTEKKSQCITEGICVWCKIRSYPYLPAMVKSVSLKHRRASVVFIDNRLEDPKRSRKGICVSLRTLKPFDCEERDELLDKAREKHNTAIGWCMNLINDYKIRIGSGSFSGSFMEYFADDISCPVRRMCVLGGGEVAFPTELEEEEEGKEEDEGGASAPEDVQQRWKVLPDRERAARNRANQRLVHFILQQRCLEDRLRAVLCGCSSSRWLSCFLARRRVVSGLYLEDFDQVDQVHQHLIQLYRSAPQLLPDLLQVDEIRLFTDVLLPEALISAIAAVENVSLKQAESKYLKGSRKSKRERQEFDLMIEQQLKAEAKPQPHRAQEELT